MIESESLPPPAGFAALERHVRRLRACRLCPKMHPPPVSGGAVWSKVLLVGQAPGNKEPVLGRPFAWTAGKTLFRWFSEQCGVGEADFRARVYMAAVCRCFPGKGVPSGDRVPDLPEIANCSRWLKGEMRLLRPELIIPVGKLAISQFLQFVKLEHIIGQQFRVEAYGHTADLIPLPHPSGASTWHRMEPGKTLLERGLKLVRAHPAWQEIQAQSEQSPAPALVAALSPPAERPS